MDLNTTMCDSRHNVRDCSFSDFAVQKRNNKGENKSPRADAVTSRPCVTVEECAETSDHSSCSALRRRKKELQRRNKVRESSKVSRRLTPDLDMAALSVGMFPVDVSMAEDRPGLGSMPKNTLPAPQLVMLANVAAECCGGGDGSVADEKEMVELKTVGCSYSDSEDESVIRVFKCTLCTYTTVSQYHWRKHLRNHFPSKLHTCSQCSYFSDRKSNYIQHIRTHTGVRPFQCAYCDYSSSQKTHLTRHMRTHSGERPFKCESCPYLAANQHEVTRHARQVHNGPKPLSCPYCEYKTADRSNFKKHVELHLNPRQFLCPLCKYAASKKCNLQYHIKSRHSGCSVELDVSKVKLRIKKPSTDTADENSKGSKSDDSSSLEEDMEEEDDHASPINLSIKKSSKTNLPETTDKSAKKPGLSSEEEKPQKVKEQEKKISTRQKKVLEGPGETTSVTDNKVKKRVKKLQAEKKRVQDQAEEPPPEKHRPGETCLQQTSQEALVKDQKVRPDKEKEPQSSKPRKCGSRKSEKKTQQVKEAPEKAMIPAKKPKPKVVKDKPTKRRAAEALDLSQKSSKTRRLKPPAAEKLPAKSSQQVESSPAVRSSRTASAKTRKSSKKASELQQTVAPSENPTPDRVPSSEAPETSSQPTGDRPAGSSKERTDSGEPAASPTEDRHPPTFIKPTLPPLLPGGQRSRPADAEDDEGIHSCQEAGSDISDSASEGSDDSGLNGTGARLSKMANDPETPTEEVPTPAGLKSHLCIFCDRTFMQEGEYRRHLNRHLVNVYYMDGASSTQK
uniref:RE1-silencing transcription factor n=1 Tax=Oryzias melastigma TaxID=30732 RepID=A0A3B3DE07_ORYME